MSCKINTKTGMEVRVPSGARSILFEKIKTVLKDDEKSLVAYDKIKDLEHTTYDRNEEPNFSFGGQDKIDDVLLTMVVNGVKFQDIVEYRNGYKKRTGKDITKNARGVADAANNVIAYALGNVSTMHEEALHLATTAIKSHPVYQRALSLINRDTNPRLWDQYMIEYNNDIGRVKKELLDKELLSHMSVPKPKGRFQITLTKILDLIKSIFNKPGLKAELNRITKLITSPDLKIEKLSDEDLQFDLEKGDLTKNMAPYEKSIETFIDKLNKLSKKTSSVSGSTLSKQLVVELNNKRHDLSMIRLINNAQEKVVQSIDRLRELKKLGDVGTAEVAKHLLKLQDTFNLYNDFIDDVQQIGISDPRLEEEMDKITSKLKKYRNEYVTIRRQLLGHILLPYFKRNTKYKTVEDLESLFEEAEELHYWDNMLSSMADSNDDYLKVVDQYIKDAVDKIEVKSFKEIRKLFTLARKIDTSSFNRFFQQIVVEGKKELGSYLLSNQNTEQYYTNMQEKFSELREHFGIPEDKKDRDKHFDHTTELGEKYAEKLLKDYEEGNLVFEPKVYEYDQKTNKKELVNISYKEFINKYPNKNEKILSYALRFYKTEQGKWFKENSKMNSTIEKDIENKFNRNLEALLYADLKKHIPKVKAYYKDKSITIDGKKINYHIGEGIENDVDDIFGDDILPSEKEDIVNSLNLYKMWYENNVRSNYQGEYYASFDLSQPNESYDSVDYSALNTDDRNFLAYLHKLKQKNLDMKTIYPLDLVPQMAQGLQERIESGSPSAIFRSIKEGIKINLDDTEFGEIVDGEKVIPVFFGKKIEDMSRDLVTVFSAYLVNANHHIEMSKIEASLNLTLDVAQDRTIVNTQKDWLNRAKVDQNKDSIKIAKGKGGKNFERLEAQIESVVYGNQQAADDFVPKELAKPLAKLQEFVSLNSLGFNIYSGVANIITSVATRVQERIANKALGDIDKEAYKKADKFYMNYVKGVFQSYQNPSTTDKSFILSQFLGIMEDFQQDLVQNDMGKNTLLTKGKSLPYAMNTLGEHFVSHKTALAKGFSIKLNDSTGKETNLIDAIISSINSDGEINFEGYTRDGKAFTELDAKRVGREINKINQSLFGIYNSVDKSQAQRYVLGRLVSQFRKFIVPTVNRRWQTKQFDFQLGVEKEGMYRTTGKMLWATYKETGLLDALLLRSTNKEINEMLKKNPELYKNIIKTKVELAGIVGAIMIGAILTKLAEDDDDNPYLAFLAYQANRHYKEMTFSLDPRSALEIMASPAAAVNQVQSMFNFIKAFTPLDGVTGGDFLRKYKDGTDELYLERALLNQVPFYKTLKRASDPTQQFNFTK
jgi:hypothetical protein